MSIFNEVQMSGVPSNSFDLSHDVKLSMDMGQLVPVNLIECIPGDVVNLSSTVMARLAPMISPPMHKIDIDVQHFFVPNRLIWDGWEKFITTGTPDGSTPAAPYFASSGVFPSGSLGDYLGIPTGVPITANINALPFAAYRKIWFDYYRDENLQVLTYDDIKCTNGLQSTASGWQTTYNDVLNRAWNHDYFTSALPFAQKGDEVKISLATSAGNIIRADGANYTGVASTPVSLTGTAGTKSGSLFATDGGSSRALAVDLTTASAVTINQLRWAVRLQEYLEKNARGGTRYIEHILSHFGVHSSDKRLRRSEFLGGSRQAMVISEVLQNAPSNAGAGTSEDTPQGNMAGHGISIGSGNDFKYYCEEHGFIISICSVRPKSAYQQGLHKLWNRFDPLQYAFPSFANLGEQEIKNKELYYLESDGQNDVVFGYTPRYSEYKYMESRVCGDMRTNLRDAGWHMGRKFTARPLLNANFIQCKSSETDHIFAVTGTSTHNIYMQILNELHVRRCLPKHGIPTL